VTAARLRYMIKRTLYSMTFHQKYGIASGEIKVCDDYYVSPLSNTVVCCSAVAYKAQHAYPL
jgi:hypothetical protein